MDIREVWQAITRKYNLEQLLLPSEKDFIYLKKHLGSIKSKNYTNILVIGMGATCSNVMALMSHDKINKNIKFLNNIDPTHVSSVIQHIDPSTLILIISRSGNTFETNVLAEYFAPKFSNNLYIICPFNNNKLRQTAGRYNIKHITVPECISGRFGIFGLASVLPPALLGFNIEEFYISGYNILHSYINDPDILLDKVDTILNNVKNNKNIYVTQYYNKNLKGLCIWWKQLLSESLGKKGFGITPVISEGLLDHHIQLQLFLDGPKDKMYEILYNNYSYLQDSFSINLARLTQASAKHIYQILCRANDDMNIEFKSYEYVSEKDIAEYTILWMLITILIGHSKNINPFNQPKIEEIKIKSKKFFDL